MNEIFENTVIALLIFVVLWAAISNNFGFKRGRVPMEDRPKMPKKKICQCYIPIESETKEGICNNCSNNINYRPFDGDKGTSSKTIKFNKPKYTKDKTK
jgi:hypothetical protein